MKEKIWDRPSLFKIMEYIPINREFSASDISFDLKLNYSNVIKNMKILSDLGITESKKEGAKRLCKLTEKGKKLKGLIMNINELIDVRR